VKNNRTLIIVIGAIVAVLALAGIAVVISGDDESTGVLAPGETRPEPSGPVEQNRPVDVAGPPLVTLDDTVVPDPGIGAAFPEMEGQTFDGTPISLGGATDGPTLLVFLAHWCPACNQEVPELIELRNRDGIPADMGVIGISTAVDNSAPNYPPSDWLADRGWPWETVADDAQSTAFLFGGGSGFPYLVILDADGNVLARDSGTKPAEELAVWIADALATAA
jgi:cytochrome c biogenesis protein CcmG, thiol:disulfide interchange protein DsbE